MELHKHLGLNKISPKIENIFIDPKTYDVRKNDKGLILSNSGYNAEDIEKLVQKISERMSEILSRKDRRIQLIKDFHGTFVADEEAILRTGAMSDMQALNVLRSNLIDLEISTNNDVQRKTKILGTVDNVYGQKVTSELTRSIETTKRILSTIHNRLNSVSA
jgi:hypothetical protein